MDMNSETLDILNPFTATTTKDNYVLSVINDLTYLCNHLENFSLENQAYKIVELN